MKEHNMKRTVVLLATLLLSFGLINAQVDYGEVNLVLGGAGFLNDTIRIDLETELQIHMLNDTELGGMSLGIETTSPDGATWTWSTAYSIPNLTNGMVSAGYGRMLDGSTFDMTGLLVTQADVDGVSPDVIMCGGVAMMAGVPIGPLEHQYSYHFTAAVPNPETDVKTMCFDSIFVPPSGAFVFVNKAGGAYAPVALWGDQPMCYPVNKNPNFCPHFDGDDPVAMSVDHCGSGTIAIDATDTEGNDIQFALVSSDGGGTAVVNDLGGGDCELTYTPVPADVGAAITIVVGLTDAFNDPNCETHTVAVSVTNNPPTIECGAPYNPVGFGNTLIKTDILGNDADACDILTYVICSGPGTIDPVTGEYVWATTLADTGLHVVCVGVTDGYGEPVCCCFEVEVLLTEPYEVGIEKVHEVLQGHFVDVNVCLNKGSELMGGFDFLIGYDASALAFTEAALGDFFVQCGWEFFTYRFNWNGNCGNACPSGLLRVVGLAETNNGPNHPNWDCLAEYRRGDDCYDCGTPIVVLTFFVSNDRTLECMFAPVRFYWMDCGDNTISVVSGDTLAINRYIYDIGSCQYSEIQDYEFGFPGYYGAPDWCLAGDKVTPVRFIDFCNGGIDIICADSIDARGDINVNGVANEIADAVMFTNYFISGLSAFGNHVEASIAASDVNADGIALSVADLVYLTRVIIGDANPYPKPLPETPVTISAKGGIITYDSPVDMGAALLTFTVNGEYGNPQLGSGASAMDLKFAREGNELRVLVFNIGSEAIAAGANVLVTIPGDVELTGAEVATYDGVGIDALVRTIPREFAVQNYPNPFNPKTRIALSLPEASDWSVKIFNIAGQLVNEFSGNADAGLVEVMWEGTDNSGNTVASGIYFYKAQAGNYTATKKMMLMK
jgi:hypothetical protein